MRKAIRDHAPFPILIQHKDATADLAVTSNRSERGITRQCDDSTCTRCN